MKVVFLFPGQGAQFKGMAMDLLESAEVKNLFNMASDILKQDMTALLRDSETETLMRTDISQPAITLASLAAAACLKEKGISPSACAGFSLGEYAAMATSGVLSTEDCFYLIGQRGSIMQAAADKLKTSDGESPGMAAVIGLLPEDIEALINNWKKEDPSAGIFAANFNSPKQTVVSGTAAALAEASKRFTDAGAKRFITLKVAGPFHSPLMAEAAEKFGTVLEGITFNDPVIPLFSNVTGKEVKSGEEIKKLALAHITSPVRWTDEEKSIAGLNPDKIIEAGPGKVLQGLWKDFLSANADGIEIPCFGAGTAAEINSLL